MKRLLIIAALTAAFIAPVSGQTVYKCPQPDGKISYQRARCPEGSRMAVQDNGKASGGNAPVTAAPVAINPAAGSGIRPGEQQMLEDIKQRERENRALAAEYAKAQAIQEHQKAVENMSQQMHQDAQQRIQLMKKGYR